MLTPRRAGPMGPDEIGNGPDDKSASNSTSGSVTPGGTYEHGDNSKEFLSTGRTGRRNALPDILGRHAETGLSDLSDRFEELSTDTGVNSRCLTAHDLDQGNCKIVVNNK